MGESMSKRLKLQLGGEAEMEERAFANPYPDYQPQGAVAAPSAADAHRDRALQPPAEEDSLPFGADGKVSPGRRAGAMSRTLGPASPVGCSLPGPRGAGGRGFLPGAALAGPLAGAVGLPAACAPAELGAAAAASVAPEGRERRGELREAAGAQPGSSGSELGLFVLLRYGNERGAPAERCIAARL